MQWMDGRTVEMRFEILSEGPIKLPGIIGAHLNQQLISRCPPAWIFIRNFPFILPLGEKWMEWGAVHSAI